MHLLDNDSDKRPVASERARSRPLAAPQISTDGRLAAPTMDHLDALEAQSIYIFREAFARLKKLALLWSLGKDSNVMIWLARKAFFGRVPFPALHVDTGKKFAGDVCVSRSLRQGMGARSEDRTLPAARDHRSDPAAGGALRRAQDRRTETRARQIWL